MISRRDLRTGELVDLAGDVVGGVLTPTEDGAWVPAVCRGVSAPEDRRLPGVQDLARGLEFAPRRREQVN